MCLWNIPATEDFPPPTKEPPQASLSLQDSGPRQRLIVTLIIFEALLRHHQRHLIQVRGLIFYRVSERTQDSLIS